MINGKKNLRSERDNFKKMRDTKALKNTNQEEEENPSGNDVNLPNLNPNPKVFLQNFKAKFLSSDKEKIVSVLCDTGSQKLIKLKQLNGNFTYNFEVLDQAVICENVPPVSEGPWLYELKDLGVILTDTKVSSESIQVLIGADIMGRLLTGKRKLLLSGLVAVETHLGWTLMEKVPQVKTERVNLAMTVTSLFIKEAEIADVWRLGVLWESKIPWRKSQNKR
ncbi:hypothetical protein AVEN_18573-1 [Araneus ventricosus]|uniref:Peptidase aspartic putative domain-containing protein n=1 Tax=Araneus ventricosus TaxID=182803 RepID=A0A4Y2L3Q1_ARAVE|nr:hypothetical protein AVEN_18573-1 [Araneus ventricosus]